MSIFTREWERARVYHWQTNPEMANAQEMATTFAIYRYGQNDNVRDRFVHDTYTLSVARAVQDRAEYEPALLHDRCAECQTRLPLGVLQYPANPTTGAPGTHGYCLLCILAAEAATQPIVDTCAECAGSFYARGMVGYMHRAPSNDRTHRAHEKAKVCASCAIALLARARHTTEDSAELTFVDALWFARCEAQSQYYNAYDDTVRETYRALTDAWNSWGHAFGRNSRDTSDTSGWQNDVFACDDCDAIAQRAYMHKDGAAFTFTGLDEDGYNEECTGCVCQMCAENYRTCEQCADTYRSDTDEYEDGRSCAGRWYCASCYDDYFFTCERCDEVTDNDYARETPNGCCWCESCFEQVYEVCGRCDRTVRSVYETSNWGYVCESCYADSEEYEEENSGTACLESYSTDVRSATGIYPENGALCFGVELEYEASDGSNVRDIRDKVMSRIGSVAVCKKDGSLNNGLEVVTAPLSLDDTRATMTKLLAEGIDGARAANTAGMHVHVSKSALTPRQVARIILFMGTEDNLDFLNAIARRDLSENTYCKLKQRDWRAIVRRYSNEVYNERTSCYEVRETWRIYSDNDRYQALNVTSKGTLEFRLFASTTQTHQAIAAVEFCAALVAFSAARIPILNARSPLAFVAFVNAHAVQYPVLAKRFTKPRFARWNAALVRAA